MINHIHVKECDSTQDILKEQLRLQYSYQQCLVSCERQKEGRGRGSKRWESYPGTLCLSLNVSESTIPSFTALELSVLVSRFFEKKSIALRLKWPNDLLNESGNKCCGILIQNHQGSMLAGIGLNLYFEGAEFGGIFPNPFPLDHKKWALEIAEFILQHRYTNMSELKADWEKRCTHLNDEVMILEGEQTFIGKFKRLGEHGEAILLSGEDELHLYNGSLKKISPDRRGSY